MGLLDRFRKDNAADEIEKLGFSLSLCPAECADCETQFPKLVLVDTTLPLYNSTLPYGLHIVVPSNKTDWPHNAVECSKLAEAVDHWALRADLDLQPKKVKVTVSSQATKSDSPETMKGVRGDILLLPFFVRLTNVLHDEAAQALDEVVPQLIALRDKHLPFAVSCSLKDVSVTLDESNAYVFLCSHRTRDKRCGITAPIMKNEMDMHLRDLGLYRDYSDERPGGVHVAFINHVGGHKFVANVIIYLRKSAKNIWLARCSPVNAVPIIDECIVNDGRVWPDKVRQVQQFKATDW